MWWQTGVTFNPDPRDVYTKFYHTSILSFDIIFKIFSLCTQVFKSALHSWNRYVYLLRSRRFRWRNTKAASEVVIMRYIKTRRHDSQPECVPIERPRAPMRGHALMDNCNGKLLSYTQYIHACILIVCEFS